VSCGYTAARPAPLGVQPTNLANYAMMLIGLIVVNALAAFLPARRAMKIDPLTALRYE
jgi:ABC-type lipoprotein release transport system permease subunit